MDTLDDIDLTPDPSLVTALEALNPTLGLPATVKRCPKCDEVKALSAFSNQQKGLHGKRSQCKPCAATASRDRRSESTAAMRKYSETHPEQAAKVRQYLEKCREEGTEPSLSDYQNGQQ